MTQQDESTGMMEQMYVSSAFEAITGVSKAVCRMSRKANSGDVEVGVGEAGAEMK